MSRKSFFSILIYILFISKGAALAEIPLISEPVHFIDTASHKTQGFLGLPLFYYTPDTRFAFGAMGVYYFTIPGDSGMPATRLSYAKLLIDYTQNRQLDIWNSWNIFFKNENYLSKGEIRFRNFPDRFYGIGNKTSSEQEERYDYNLLSIKTLFLKKIYPGFFAGPDIQLVYSYDFHHQSGGQLEKGTITGFKGGLNSGMGMVGIYDKRDNVVYPMKGMFMEVSSYMYGKYLGSDFVFANVNFTYNIYYTLFDKTVIASNTVFNFNFGDPPFIYMAMAGNDDLLRGYARNRFRDKHFGGTQIEYRMPLFWRIGMACFAGIGDVFGPSSETRFNNLKYSFGGGLRYTVNKKEHLNIRLDYGIGRGNSSFYIMIAEAF